MKEKKERKEKKTGVLAAQRKRIWNIALGIFFFILGCIGILIPVMPQVMFFLLSALFFSRASKRFRTALRRYRKRHPKVDRLYENWRRKAREKRQRLIREARRMRRGFEEKIDDLIYEGDEPPQDRRDAR